MARVFIPDQVAFLRERIKTVLEKNGAWLDGALPDVLVDMLVTGEDKRFWSHRGVDVAAMSRAVYQFAVQGRVQGASTIEQQLARTLTGYRDFSVKRKLREIVLACVVRDFLSKRDVAGLYLCCAYYGWRMNSLAEAGRRMGWSVALVGPRESAELIARLRYPQPHCATTEWQTLMRRRAVYILRKAGYGNSL